MNCLDDMFYYSININISYGVLKERGSFGNSQIYHVLTHGLKQKK